jgi:HlyD family secretion protein
MAATSDNIFRQAALERLSSPDQLDRLISLSSPLSWAALAALLVLLAAIVSWSILGTVPTRVPSTGILLERGGQVFDAMAPATGPLASVAAIGTKVGKGDVVATLDDTQQEQDLEHARTILREQEQDLGALTERFEREIAARRKVDIQLRENLAKIITTSEQRRNFYSDMLRVEEPISDKGFITRRFVQETRQQMESAEQELRRARSDLLRLDAEELDLLGRRDQEIYHQQEKVNGARRAVAELTIRASRNTRIISPIAGHVTEVKASVGTVVGTARPVLSIETAGEGLELLLYISPEQGKKVVPGMEVRVEPATAKKEEFGTLLGYVSEISEFPVSGEGMMAVLQNQQLVTRFMAQGAPYAARVKLLPDASTASGYAWSAGPGPPLVLSSGTTASADITVRRQAPITLVLPLLREKLGIDG